MPWSLQGKICVQTSSCGVQCCSLVRQISLSDPAYRALFSRRSKRLLAISRSPHWRSLRLRLIALSLSSCFQLPFDRLTTLKSRSDSKRHAPNSSKGKTSGQRSKKLKPQEKVPVPKPWTDQYHPAAAKEVVQLSSTGDRRPSVKDAIADVLLNPYANSKKAGSLKNCRAKVFSLDGVQYRALYELDEKARIVYFWCVAPRERVYGVAKNRVR
jgi:mRNA-degrading endonuclease RelE of RelBE toxin-antitoxin system